MERTPAKVTEQLCTLRPNTMTAPKCEAPFPGLSCNVARRKSSSEDPRGTGWRRNIVRNEEQSQKIKKRVSDQHQLECAIVVGSG